MAFPFHSILPNYQAVADCRLKHTSNLGLAQQVKVPAVQPDDLSLIPGGELDPASYSYFYMHSVT